MAEEQEREKSTQDELEELIDKAVQNPAKAGQLMEESTLQIPPTEAVSRIARRYVYNDISEEEYNLIAESVGHALSPHYAVYMQNKVIEYYQKKA